MSAIYVYAIIPTSEEGFFEVAGVDGHYAEVYTVPYNGLAAVVSASPLEDYQALKRDEAARYLVAHQRVVETVMKDHPLLPVKFGAVLPNEGQVRRLLEQGEMLFLPTLEKFTGLVQMEVVVLWELQDIFQEIAQEEPIMKIKEQVADRPPEETVAERMAVGQLVQTSLERRRLALQNLLLPALHEVALDTMTNPLMDDSMVANVALLVDEAGCEALDERLVELDEEFEGKLYFRCVGPLSPFSFATVEVQMPTFEDVDEARRHLKLGKMTTASEIKRAYHRMAGLYHPDHHPDDPGAEAQMAELTQAYHLLTTYAEKQMFKKIGCRSQFTENGDMFCDLSQSAVEQTLMIAIRRQEISA